MTVAKILFVFAHPDDETLAAGVAIAEHVAAGHDVAVAWLTRGEGSGVLAALNGQAVSAWWGVLHVPVDEGYAVLSAGDLADAREREAGVAVDALVSDLGAVTRFRGDLPDGGVTHDDALMSIRAIADTFAPGTVAVRLKSHTHAGALDEHPDHVAIGSAVRTLQATEPGRFGDCRFYILPGYWTDADLFMASPTWDQPSNVGIKARAINACRAYGAWAPATGSYAVGFHSRPTWFGMVMAAPKCLYHA